MSIELFECDCHAEGISLEHVEGDVYVSIWEMGYGPGKKRALWDRIRHAWKILTKGDAYADQITLNPFEAKSFGEKVIELSRESEKYWNDLEKDRPRKTLDEVTKEISSEGFFK